MSELPHIPAACLRAPLQKGFRRGCESSPQKYRRVLRRSVRQFSAELYRGSPQNSGRVPGNSMSNL